MMLTTAAIAAVGTHIEHTEPDVPYYREITGTFSGTYGKFKVHGHTRCDQSVPHNVEIMINDEIVFSGRAIVEWEPL